MAANTNIENSMPENDEQLQELVKSLSLTAFALPFRHQCRFNSRLRAVGGRYLLQSHNLEFSLAHALRFGLTELKGTILHELCHYHLHLRGAGFRHRDQDFKRLLQKVGGSRFAQSLEPRKDLPLRYLYACTRCGKHYERRVRLSTSRFVCGVCRSALQLIIDRQEGM